LASQQDGLIAEELSEEDFRTFEVLKLNYSSDAHFIYDNRTRDDVFNQSRDIFGTSSFPVRSSNEFNKSNASETMNTTEIPEDVKTNIGIRREDMFNFLIVYTQEYAENLRHLKQSGEMRYLSDYPDAKQDMLK
jgi:hypothetical protein